MFKPLMLLLNVINCLYEDAPGKDYSRSSLGYFLFMPMFLSSRFLSTLLLLFWCLFLPLAVSLAVPMRDISCVGYKHRAWHPRSL